MVDNRAFGLGDDHVLCSCNNVVGCLWRFRVRVDGDGIFGGLRALGSSSFDIRRPIRCGDRHGNGAILGGAGNSDDWAIVGCSFITGTLGGRPVRGLESALPYSGRR